MSTHVAVVEGAPCLQVSMCCIVAMYFCVCAFLSQEVTVSYSCQQEVTVSHGAVHRCLSKLVPSLHREACEAGSTNSKRQLHLVVLLVVAHQASHHVLRGALLGRFLSTNELIGSLSINCAIGHTAWTYLSTMRVRVMRHIWIRSCSLALIDIEHCQGQ